ncbi:hypothetical protein ISTM_340 [Insectomime virus]|uniref:Uncharacterized protein n=1 Tax=Tunisvirus fontaine2 TaxID=1421067 RepID=V9SHD5_9VIRU|nr:hypothetical protein D1R32_gp460 [Tunisvirus fontaine2]AHA46238.1 hypothetical protein ISTM_340 [Insectomime virus]AHC55177.1 hypothetical protein TNS_ORF459 [Tunisvirus fontaine2]
MNKEQKERVLSLLVEAWAFRDVVPEAQYENEEIKKIFFRKNGKDVQEPLCWCGDKDCDACKKTRGREQDEFYRCRLTCNNFRRCYLCE